MPKTVNKYYCFNCHRANIQIGDGNQLSVVNNRRQHRARRVIVSEKRHRRNVSVKNEQSLQTVVDTSENRNGYGEVFVGSEQLIVDCSSSIESNQLTCSKEVINCNPRHDEGFTPVNGPEEASNDDTVSNGMDLSKSPRASTMRADVDNPSCAGSSTDESGNEICDEETRDGESASMASSTDSSSEQSKHETCSDDTDSGDSIDNTDNPKPTLRERSMKKEIVEAIIECFESRLQTHERSMKSEFVEVFKEYFEPLRDELRNLVKRQHMSDDSSGHYESFYSETYYNLTNGIVSESVYESYQDLPDYISAYDQIPDNSVSNPSSTPGDYEFPVSDDVYSSVSAAADDDIYSWGDVTTTQNVCSSVSAAAAADDIYSWGDETTTQNVCSAVSAAAAADDIYSWGDVSSTQTDPPPPANVSTIQTDHLLPIDLSTTQTDHPLPINVSTTQADYEVPANLCTTRIDYQVPADSYTLPTSPRDYQLPCSDNDEVYSSVSFGTADVTAAGDGGIHSTGDDMYSGPECERFQIMIKLKLKNGWRTNKKLFQVTVTAATTLQDLKMGFEQYYGCLVTVEYSVSKQGHVKNMSKVRDLNKGLLNYGMTTGSTVCFKSLRVVPPYNKPLNITYSQFIQHVDLIY